MEGKPTENLFGTRPVPVQIVSGMDRDDEVNLKELWRVIVRRKRLILVVLSVSVLSAVVYSLFFARPLFTASAHLLPPQQHSIQGLLVMGDGGLDGFDIKRYTPDFVYGAFLQNLRSRGLRREFFDAHELASHYSTGSPGEDVNVDRMFDTTFNKRLKMQADTSDPSSVAVYFSDADLHFAAQWLKQIIEFANERTVQQLLSDVNGAIRAEAKDVRRQLAAKLKLAEQRRQDTLASLKEALRVAETLGIKDAGAFPDVANKTQERLTVNTAQLPLYMRGTVALEAEIAVLESRKSDEPFISGFRDLQEQLGLLEGISIDAESLSAVTLDEVPRLPYTAKPKKALIVLLAAVLGAIVGITGAFVAESLSRRRQQEKGMPT
jgi:chain length determinant protein (polysaccharide antigen chain regulator)